MKSKDRKPVKGKYNEALKYTGIATKMTLIICAGVFGGIKLDEMSNRDFPLWTLILSLLSVILAMYQIINDVLRK